MDHFLDSLAHLSRTYVMSIVQNIINCIFTLVALCRATSAKLQDFDQDINIESEVSKSSIAEEEQALERMLSTF